VAGREVSQLESVLLRLKEGKEYELTLILSRTLSDEELDFIAQKAIEAFDDLKEIRLKGKELTFDFKTGPLPLIAIIVGGLALLGIIITGFILRERLPGLALPIGLGVAGSAALGLAYFLRREPKTAIPAGVTGLGLLAGAGYLGWRQLFPPPPVPKPSPQEIEIISISDPYVVGKGKLVAPLDVVQCEVTWRNLAPEKRAKEFRLDLRGDLTWVEGRWVKSVAGGGKEATCKPEITIPSDWIDNLVDVKIMSNVLGELKRWDDYFTSLGHHFREINAWYGVER